MNHFDEMTALLYLERQLDSEHAQEVRAHVATCNSCRGLLRALELEDVWLRQSLDADDESIPAHLARAPERSSIPWGWISAIGLSAGGAYTMWSGIVEPWRAQAAQSGFTQGNILTMLFFSGAFWKGWDAMRSLTEFLALATLGMLVIWLLRRHLHRMTTVVVAMGAVLLMLASAPAGRAADTRHGDPNYTLAAGEVVHTDLIVSADTTRIDGDVDGDLIAFSRSVTVNGHIKGDVIAFSQELHINGPVDGNVRASCQSLTLNNVVARNVMAWAGEVNLNEKAKVGGTMTLGAGDSDLAGEVGGDLLAGMGNLEINGILDQNAMINAGHLTIGPKAEIKGSVKFQGHEQPEVSPSAKLGSPIQVTIEKRGEDSSRYSSPRFYWHQVLLWGASFVFGLAMLLLMPGFFFDAAAACKRTASAVGFGVLFLFAIPIAAIIVCITIVGLGVGIAALMLWAISLFAAQVIVAAWLGNQILGPSIGMGAALGRMALGLLILRAVGIIPYLGFWIILLVICFGLGAIILALYRHMRPHLEPAVI